MPSVNQRSRVSATSGVGGIPRDVVKRTRRDGNRSNKRSSNVTIVKPPAKKKSSEVPPVLAPFVAPSTAPPSEQKTKSNTVEHKTPTNVEDQKKKKDMDRMKDQKETKRKRKKVEEKPKEEEKKPSPVRPPATIRPSKNKSSATTPSDSKTEELPLRPASKSKSRKRQSGSSDAPDKESLENKSSNSKEPSETDEKEKKKEKARKEAAQKFFKELKVQKQSTSAQPRRSFVESLRMDVMPELSQLNQSVRAMRKKIDKSMRMKMSVEVPEKTEPHTELTEIFKPNGDPIWMVPERQPGDPVEKTEDGIVIENPELARALAEEDLKIEEKMWADTVGAYLDDKMPAGQVMERSQQCQLDPYAEFDELKKNDEFLSAETVNYMTAKTLHEMCYEAVNRFDRKRNCLDEPERERERFGSRVRCSRESDSKPEELVMKPSEFIEPLKTGYSVAVGFDMKRTVYYSYDRRCPIASAQALNKKMQNAASAETEPKEGADMS